MQLSFFSAEAHPPRVADLVGLLCGPGQAVRFGDRGTARFGVVLDGQWRAQALAQACLERAVQAEVATTGTERPVLRTEFRADLEPLAARWSRGAVKAVPADFELLGPVLRLWVMAAGQPEGHLGYLLGLDPHAPQSYPGLAAAAARAGVAGAVLRGGSGGPPALRITGRRRLRRLAELVGARPLPQAEACWPVGE